MSQLDTSAGLSFGVSVVRGDWSVLIGGRLGPSLPLAPRANSSVGRAPSLQGGCRRFESGWLHLFRLMVPAVAASLIVAVSAPSAFARRTVPAVAASLIVAVSAPSAFAARTCHPPKFPGNGYFTSLGVTHTDCATGKKVALAYYRCPPRHGIRGRCAGVLGYTCKETRQSIPTEFDARVTCKHGRVVVVHTYQQNT